MRTAREKKLKVLRDEDYEHDDERTQIEHELKQLDAFEKKREKKDDDFQPTGFALKLREKMEQVKSGRHMHVPSMNIKNVNFIL